MNRLEALLVLFVVAYGANAVVGEPFGTLLAFSAMSIWFLAGDGRAQLSSTWNRFTHWLPSN